MRLKFIFILSLLFCFSAHAESTNSLSDISLGQFAPKKEVERNPFTPPSVAGNLDPSALELQGVLVGPNVKFCLIAGKILKPGNVVENFIVKDIEPGMVLIQSVKGETKIYINGYIRQNMPLSGNFEIAFAKADLKPALQMIGSAGKFNMILPESLSGTISLTFHDTTLMNALSSILTVNNLVYAEENGIIRVGSPESFAGGSHLQTRHIELRYATAQTLIDQMKPLLSEGGSVTADVRTNTLTVKDTPAVLTRVEALVQQLDILDTQVRIEAKIIDVTKRFSQSLGIQWGFIKTDPTARLNGFGANPVGTLPNTGEPPNVNLPAQGPSQTDPTSGVGILLRNINNGIDLEAQITAAEQNGDAHLISHPSITTVNNAPANIRSGLTIYVRELQVADGTTTEGGLLEIETGIELTVTPQISLNDLIKLKIDAVESEADFTRTVDGIPSVIDNQASTTVIVKDGDTTVIGGMMKVRKTNEKNAVPFIENIPILGWLTKNKIRASTDNELLIFITPRILKRVDSTLVPLPEISSIPEYTEKPAPIDGKMVVTDGVRYEKLPPPAAANKKQNSSKSKYH